MSSLNPNIKVDLIILPGVLHEVDDALQFLKLCVKHIKNKGKIYINVPNANSLHRKIAVAMNIIKKTLIEVIEIENYNKIIFSRLKIYVNL